MIIHTYMHALTDNCAYGICTKYARIQHSCNIQQADTSTVACTKMDDRISPDDQKGCLLEDALTTPEIEILHCSCAVFICTGLI